ncbi:MAG: TlyA family RNA methyltransferase [Desulfobacterales bacterium]|nr:TlyA family RNA methyltransferase [Desulfobacterales bacterium]
MKAPRKKRLDVLVVEKGLAKSRETARTMIMAGNILVDDQPMDKPGTQVFENAVIINRKPDMPYVSRGGQKLSHAISELKLDVRGMVCLDVGASTGGFTDCLLQCGAAHVYAIDVGYGQLDWKLRRDSRVTVMERTNIRYVTPEILSARFDLITIDVSFISLKIVVPAVEPFLKPDGQILALIKPQFEVGRDQVGKGGVVRDPRLHEGLIEKLSAYFKALSLVTGAVIPSPVLGPKGNREFVVHLCRRAV